LPASNRYTTTYDLKTGVACLKINEVQTNDSGNYELIAENPAGSDRTKSTLTVNVSPNIDQSPIIDPNAFKYLEPTGPSQVSKDIQLSKATPPKVIVPLKDLNTQEGQPITFLTKITGYPIPNVSRI
jgi:hypothetical protein